MGISHFTELFKAQSGTSIREIAKGARIFPCFVDDEDRESLMTPVTKHELLVVMKTFQKGKSLGLDGWTIELFLGFFDLLGDEILKVVEESRQEGHIHELINATFIALIPKSDNLDSFDDFRLISLCNCIYKIISKIINLRLKDTLSQHITGEQFGFLKRR